MGQGVGGWIRLGLYPNRRTAWINALLCGPDMPTVAINDFEAALPDDPGTVRTDAFELTLTAIEPLRTYRVQVRGQGEAYDDPAALLHGASGAPVELAMDLVWTTAGTPYQYRITPRYEIPCTVAGTVTVGGRDVTRARCRRSARPFVGCARLVGMDWVWSALHLDDGTHLHGVDIRIPGAPRIGVGYRQTAGDAATRTARR